MVQRVIVPLILPRGRQKDETGQFVDVPARTVPCGINAPPDQQYRDIEDATAPFGEDIIRELLGLPLFSSGIENDRRQP